MNKYNSDKYKIFVAKRFISKHRTDIANVNMWGLYFDTKDDAYLFIYKQLNNGQYGIVTSDDIFSFISISKCKSFNNKIIIFKWVK